MLAVAIVSAVTISSNWPKPKVLEDSDSEQSNTKISKADPTPAPKTDSALPKTDPALPKTDSTPAPKTDSALPKTDPTPPAKTDPAPARAGDVDAVKEKLFQAKKGFDAEVQNFKKAVSDLLDMREDTARKEGDKKDVDRIKAERAAFEKTGEPTQVIMIPDSIREPVTAARIKLNKAYTDAVKEYVRLKMDDEAEATEKEQQEFLFSSALSFGKRTSLNTLNHFDVKVWNNTFSNNGTYRFSESEKTSKLKVNGELVPHTILLHPTTNSYSQVRYTLGGRWVALQATIGVPKIWDAQPDPRSLLTFEVMGDDKSLWKSEPVTKMDQFQTCTVNIEKVKTLTLRVHCPEKFNWACAFWIEPFLVE
jgi:hypothetical protein